MTEQTRFLNLLDIVSPDFLKDLLTRFTEATGVKTLISDILGKPLIWPECENFFCKFCGKLRDNPETRIQCEKCDAFGGISASHNQLPLIYRCHMDLVEVAVPIFVNDQYLGAITMGEIRVEQTEHDSLPRIILPEFDLNSNQDLKALYEISRNEFPLIPLNRLHSLSNMLHSIANYITEISANSILKDDNHKLNMRILHEQNQKNELEKNLKQMYIRNIEAYLKPQYLFNVLNTINNLVLLENPERASEVISSLSKIMRYNLRHADQLSTIGEEMESIQNYLSIKNICLEDKRIIETSIDEDCYDAIIPPFSIQTLVENSFIHGVESKIDGGTVYLEITELTNRIKILVSDSGAGMSSSQLKDLLDLKNSQFSNNSSSTLTNIIKILSHYFEDEFSWDVQSGNQGTTLIFIIPYWRKERGLLL